MRVIDGTGLIVGRVATYVAKKALEGEKVSIVNCEKMVWTGSKDVVFKMFKERRERGSPHWGPYYPKMSDRIIRRAVRGMLPYKKERGMTAFRRVMCYRGVPFELKDKRLDSLKNANYVRLKTIKFIEVGKIARLLGGR